MDVKTGKKYAGPAVCAAGLLLLCLAVFRKDTRADDPVRPGEILRDTLSARTGSRLLQNFVPVFSFVEEENTGAAQIFADRTADQLLPLYSFLNREERKAARVEDQVTIDMILMAEASGECGEAQPQEGEASSENLESPVGTAPQPGEQGAQTGPSAEELMRTENEAAGQAVQTAATGEFVPHMQQVRVDMDALRQYEDLIKTFYTVDKTTMIGSDQLNVDTLSAMDMTVSRDTDGPQILIYHTHSQEAFADSTPGDISTGIVGVGEYLTRLLTEKYGYRVLHHTGQYDAETRDDAYSRALPAIEQVLKENPGIQVVIDLHRDAMAEETHLVMDLDGRPTARFMFFNGLSRTKKTGNISYLYNENLEANLAFSFQMQKKAAEYYPGLTRKIYLKGYRYNMHLKPRTLLVELGAQNNSLEEAMNACDPLAHILDMVLSGSG